MKVELNGDKLILFIIILILVTLVLDVSISLIVGTLFMFILKQAFLPIFLKLLGACICLHMASGVRAFDKGHLKYKSVDGEGTLTVDISDRDEGKE